jgi:hypothetical protein
LGFSFFASRHRHFPTFGDADNAMEASSSSPPVTEQMITVGARPPGFHRPVYHRHTPHLWAGRFRRRSLSCRIHHRATVPRRIGRIAGGRRRTSNPPGVRHGPTAGEATNSRRRSLHLLRNIRREISAVRYNFLAAPNVPASPRPVAPRHQGNSEAGRTAFRVARHTEGLPNLGTRLPGLPAPRGFHPHGYSNRRLHAAGNQFSSRRHRCRLAPFKVRRLSVLPHYS